MTLSQSHNEQWLNKREASSPHLKCGDQPTEGAEAGAARKVRAVGMVVSGQGGENPTQEACHRHNSHTWGKKNSKRELYKKSGPGSSSLSLAINTFFPPGETNRELSHFFYSEDSHSTQPNCTNFHKPNKSNMRFQILNFNKYNTNNKKQKSVKF